MKKTLAVILSVIMLIACISVSVSASVGVDDYTSASDMIAPNAENISVTTYDPDGKILNKYEKLFDEKTGVDVYIYYAYDDNGELIVDSRIENTYDEKGRVLTEKSYSYNYETGKLELSYEMTGTHTDTESKYEATGYTDGEPATKVLMLEKCDASDRIVVSYMESRNIDGSIIYSTKDEHTYSEDGNISIVKFTVTEDEVNYDISYSKTEHIKDGNTETVIRYESEDGENYTPTRKGVCVKDGALKETVIYYDYEDGEWILETEDRYEYDREDRESLWVHDADYGLATHKFSADGKKAIHTYFDKNDNGEDVESAKVEENFIDEFRRSVISRYYLLNNEWKQSYDFVFEYNDEDCTYKVSAIRYDRESGEKELTEYAIVKYKLNPADENPETGDFVSMAVSLMSFAAIGGTTLITRKKVK